LWAGFLQQRFYLYDCHVNQYGKKTQFSYYLAPQPPKTSTLEARGGLAGHLAYQSVGWQEENSQYIQNVCVFSSDLSIAQIIRVILPPRKE
jgi:glucan phosphorylase